MRSGRWSKKCLDHVSLSIQAEERLRQVELTRNDDGEYEVLKGA